MQVVTAELVGIAITLVLIFASAVTISADELGQYVHQQRVLNTFKVGGDDCHETMLSSPLGQNTILVKGIVFSLRSTAASSVSSLSVYLDENASKRVQFDLYAMNGVYIYGDGTNSIGTALDGSGVWKRIHGGTIADTQRDDDGATFLGSFGNQLLFGAGEIKSIYLSFTNTVLRVSSPANTADVWDGNANTLNGHSMQISVGRSAIFWSLFNEQSQFDAFYTPSIVPCKVWTREACPPTYAPSLSPSTTSSPTTTRIIETVTIVDSTIELFFGTKRLFDTRTTNGEDACSVDKDIIYPLLADSLEEVSMKVYEEDRIGTTKFLSTTITFTAHEDASSGGDCSVVRFYYDAQMQYARAENDETPPLELALQPLSAESSRGQFLSTLNSNAKGNPYFSTLSSIGPVVVTQEGLRTRSPTMPPTKSLSPTAAPSISSNPTDRPSASPSRSPIISPSSQPSFSPSSFPSSAPSTEYNYLKVDFYFYISYPPSKEKQAEADLLGNMTLAFEKRFSKSSNNLLSDFHNDPQVAFDFAETSVPTVQKITGAKDEDCIQGNAKATDFNVCERYVVIMGFQHKRKRIKSGKLLVHYVRMNSKTIGKELSISYDGDDSVMKELLLTVSNAYGPPADTDAFCDGLKEELQEGAPSYNITEVLCKNFDFIVYDSNRGLRKLQEGDLGELTVEYTVIAEYRAIDGNEPNVLEALVEDSINADGGKKVLSSLAERGLVSGKNMTAETHEMVPDPPPRTTLPQEENGGSQTGLGTTGIAIIIVCVFVVFTAGFLFYKAIQRIKVINEDPFYDYDVEGTTKPEKVYPEVYQDTSSDDEPELKILTDDQTSAEVAIVSPVIPNQPLPSMSRENIDRQGSLARLNAFENRLRQKADSERSSKQDQGLVQSDSNSSLESFERRLRKKAGESSSKLGQGDNNSTLDSFEERLRRKKESNSRLTRSDSNTSLESFERRLREKAAGSSSKRGLADDTASLDSFEDRLKRKTSEDNDRIRHSDSNSSLESFERRLRKKAGESSSKLGQGDNNSTLDSFEERLRRKKESNSRLTRSDSNTSLESFERRLREKAAGSSSKRGLADDTASLDSFEDRLKRKTREDNDRIRHSDSNSSLENFERRLRKKAGESSSKLGQGDNNSTLDFEERLRRKTESNAKGRHGDSNSSLESFEQRLRRMTEANSGRARTDSNSSLDSFEDRLRRKAREGNASLQQRKFEGSDSNSSLDAFQQRISAKNAANQRDQTVSTSSYESRLHQKLRGESLQSSGSSKPGAESVSSSKAMDSSQMRFAEKISTGSVDSRSRSNSPLSSSFEDRLRKKLSSDRSLNQPVTFEERLQRKLSEENRSSERLQKLSSQGSSRAVPSKQTLSTFEDRLQKKLSDESRPSPKSSEDRFQDVYQRARSLSKTRLEKKDSESSLDSFEKRLQRKLTDENRVAAAKGNAFDKGSSRSITSNQSSLTFEERLQKKLSDESRPSPKSSEDRFQDVYQRARSLSKTRLEKKDSESSLDSFEKRLQRKLTDENRVAAAKGNAFDKGSSRSITSNQSSLTFEERLQKKLSDESRPSPKSSEDRFQDVYQRARSLSKTRLEKKDSESSLDSFEKRLQRKLTDENRVAAAKGNAFDKGSSRSITSNQSSLTFEERLQKKLSDESRPSPKSSEDRFQDVYQRARSLSKTRLEKKDSESSLDSFEKRLQRKLTDENRVAAAKGNAFDKGSSRSITSNQSSLTFEERLQKKLSDESRPSPKSSEDRFQDVYQRARSLSKTRLEKKDSESSLDSFEKRLQRKLTDENRVAAAKGNAFDKGSSRSITSNQSSLTFEERLQKKLSDESRPSPKSSEDRFQDVYQRARSLSKTRLEKKDSESSLDSFEKRLQRKLTDENRVAAAKGNAFDKGSSRSITSNQSSLTFEERLQKKLSDESRPSPKSSEDRFQDVYQRARSLSKTRLEKKDSESSLDSFEKRLQRKLTDENRVAAAKGNAFDKGSSRSITSNQSSLTFEERLQKKLSDGSRPSPKSS